MKQNMMNSFKRDISYSVSQPDCERILLIATMRDLYHHIVLEVLVQESDLTILAANVDFHKSPEKLCSSVTDNLQKMVGFKIGKGLTRAILNSMGGEHGCVNMRNLLSGLLPLAMNVKAAAGFSDERAMLDNIRENLAGACAGYPLKENFYKENNDQSHIC